MLSSENTTCRSPATHFAPEHSHPLQQGTTMQTHVIISYDGTDNDHDALALGRILGDAGARVSLAYVRHSTEADAAAEQAAQEEAQGRLERGARLAVSRSSRGLPPRRAQRLDRRRPAGARRA